MSKRERMNYHACAIDAHSTALASIVYDETEGYSITQCRKIGTGLAEYCNNGGGKATDRLVSFLRKKQADSLVLSIHTPSFFPLETLSSRNISETTFDSHCRAEAAFLLNKPGDFKQDHIPYTLDSEQDPVRKHLLIYYPVNFFDLLYNRLTPFCSIRKTTHYLSPMIRSIAATFQPFALLEIEQNYATFSAGNNGELEYFSYWWLDHQSDAEYFALRELAANPQYRKHPVYITGNHAEGKSLAERISHSSGTSLDPLDLVALYAMKRNVRSSCCSTIELKALGAALTEFFDETPSS